MLPILKKCTVKNKPTMKNLIEAELADSGKVSCSSCQASCCRLEVMLITETGVPEHFIATDEWGGRSMKRLDDGWCAAVNRNNMDCMIYLKRPFLCREFETGSYECMLERGVV